MYTLKEVTLSDTQFAKLKYRADTLNIGIAKSLKSLIDEIIIPNQQEPIKPKPE